MWVGESCSVRIYQLVSQVSVHCNTLLVQHSLCFCYMFAPCREPRRDLIQTSLRVELMCSISGGDG